MFAGDDLGDLEAFKAVLELRRQGLATLLVCSASAEQSALMPTGPMSWSTGPTACSTCSSQFTDDAASIRA